MPTCPNCGAQSAAGTTYCPSCGTELPSDPPGLEDRGRDSGTGQPPQSREPTEGTEPGYRDDRQPPVDGTPHNQQPPNDGRRSMPPPNDRGYSEPAPNNPEPEISQTEGWNQPPANQHGQQNPPPANQHGQQNPPPAGDSEPPAPAGEPQQPGRRQQPPAESVQGPAQYDDQYQQPPREPVPEPRQGVASQPNETEEKSRRGFIFGALGLAGLGVGGWYAFQFLGQEGPDDVAEGFVAAANEADWSEANELTHSDSLFGSATNFIDILGGASSLGAIADLAIRELDIETTSATVREERDEQALVDLTINVDVPLASSADVDLLFEMRTEDGDWRVYDIGLA